MIYGWSLILLFRWINLIGSFILNIVSYHLQEYRFVLLIITSMVISIYVQTGTIIAKLKHTEEPNLLHTYSYTEDSNLFSIRGGCLLSHGFSYSHRKWSYGHSFTWSKTVKVTWFKTCKQSHGDKLLLRITFTLWWITMVWVS